MANALEHPKMSLNELEEYMASAVAKVKVSKDVLLCRFLPGENGCLHHFTFFKLKREKPEELKRMIKKHILDHENPQKLPIRERVRVKRDASAIHFNKSQIGRLVEILKKSGDTDLLKTVAPEMSLREVQRGMISLIRAKKIDKDLWETYERLIQE